MKVIIFSDPHGHLPDIKEQFDLLLLPGDLCPQFNHLRSVQRDWMMNIFAPWIKSLPFKTPWAKVVMCAGNHDFVFESASKKFIKELISATDDRLVYLENSEYDFVYHNDEIYRIYGTPICKKFGNWAFMRENLDKYYENIPEGLDILLTHDAPDINELGLIKNGKYAGTNAGNVNLASHVQRTKPTYVFCGHIHSGNHKLTEVDGTYLANVSLVNEDDKVAYEPLVMTIDKYDRANMEGGIDIVTVHQVGDGKFELARVKKASE